MGKLILTADDYGLSDSVNAATIQSVKNRTVTSVQVMANMATEEQIRELAAAIHESGNVCGIGLHFCTTAGPSLTKANASFINEDNGRFIALKDWNYTNDDHASMLAELTAQYTKLKNIIGGDRIDSFSSHQNIHFFSKDYCQMVADLSKEFRIPVRSPLRWDQEDGLAHFPEKGVDPIKQAALKTLGQCFPHLDTIAILSKGISEGAMKRRRAVLTGEGGTPDTMCGHWYGQPLKDGIEWLVDELVEMRGRSGIHISELLMHLSNSESGDELTENYKMADRKNEFVVLNSVEVMNYVNSLYEKPNFQLGSYRKVVMNQNITYNL